MEFLEKELEQIIWESSDEQLENAGLCLQGKRFRQLRIGNYGIADLVTVERRTVWDERYFDERKFVPLDSYLVITVYELKKDKIGISAFLQAINYIKGIQRYLNKRGFEDFVFRLKLIGKNIDTSGSFCYLTDFINICHPHCEFSNNRGYIDSTDFYTYKMNINGLIFERKYGYKLSNEGF